MSDFLVENSISRSFLVVVDGSMDSTRASAVVESYHVQVMTRVEVS